jgi:type IV secretion system protein VirD4
MSSRVSLFLLSPAQAFAVWLVGAIAVSAAGLLFGLLDHRPGLLYPVGLLFALALGLARFSRSHQERPTQTEGSHGTARWGDPKSLRRPAGLLLGGSGRDLLRYEDEGHILTVAPTGSGKGVGVVIPNLLDYPGSVVVVDLKGENHAVTAARREQFGAVQTLDPFRLRGEETAAFNPMALLSPDSDLCDADAATLAYLLVLPSTEGDSAFWDEEAAALLSGLLLYVAAHEPDERRHLGTVRAYLTLGSTEWDTLLQAMAASDRAHGLIARAAHRLQQKENRERSGVVSTAQRHTHFLDSPAILRTLTGSTLDLAQLKTEVLSLYLVMPPERLGSHGRWLRLVAGSAIQAMLKTPRLSPHRVLFLLDEFAQLGRLQPLEQAVTLLRGYGVRLWLLVQDLAQVRATYGPRADSILANAAVLQAFGTNDVQTAEYLSRRTGQTTVYSTSENRSTGQSFNRPLSATSQTGHAYSSTESARPLLTPDEVLRLPSSEQLLFLSGADPLRVERLDYLRDPRFRGLFAPNPMHREV